MSDDLLFNFRFIFFGEVETALRATFLTEVALLLLGIGGTLNLVAPRTLPLAGSTGKGEKSPRFASAASACAKISCRKDNRTSLATCFNLCNQ